eukprot:CAMPEP_0204822022 /NCGR_PEP_ID=MMETSP1346-20131115/209_1 /ASSEMBLY_ACC=CAM_ASM_000771 /TAXON_ID=215587 /ORGANISM="Aplanochytrium stocchinoi, Strain GSBS06" /LENGTH=269 /DNA_ID=CAMNT_0051948023 /DNA_START=29 /DNA_END=835 /DNA_ORIENTATION=-
MISIQYSIEKVEEGASVGQSRSVVSRSSLNEITIQSYRTPFADPLIKKVIAKVLIAGHYGDVPEDVVSEVCALHRDISVDIVRNIHLNSMVMKMVNATRRIRHDSILNPLLALYAEGKPMVEICAMYDLPPLTCFRVIFQKRGYSKKRIQKCLKADSPLEVYDSERDYVEIKWAFSADKFSVFDDKIAKDAEDFEVAFGKFLTSLKISFSTQTDLERLYKKERTKSEQVVSGKKKTLILPGPNEQKCNGLTPDFLINSTFRVNGADIKW